MTQNIKGVDKLNPKPLSYDSIILQFYNKSNMNKFFEKFSLLQKTNVFRRLSSKNMQPESVDDVLTLIVEFGKNSKIEIKIPEKFSRQLTCEWLLDEAIAKINEKSTIKTIQENEKSLVALKTKNKDFAVDYLLSDPKRSLQFLKDGTILEPYYGIDARPLDEFQFKVELEDFEIETMLGHGAFSTVYLGNTNFYAVI